MLKLWEAAADTTEMIANGNHCTERHARGLQRYSSIDAQLQSLAGNDYRTTLSSQRGRAEAMVSWVLEAASC